MKDPGVIGVPTTISPSPQNYKIHKQPFTQSGDEGNKGEDFSMAELKINLKPLTTQLTYHNEADTLLIQIADTDDNIEILDKRDFTVGIPKEDVDRFLHAAEAYVEGRMKTDADDGALATKFLKEVGDIKSLPSRYHSEPLPGIHRNPYRISRFLRGQLEGFAHLGGVISSAPAQGQEVDWSMMRKGLGLIFTWPLDESLPLLDRFPYVHAGFLSTVSESEGSLKQGDTRLGDINAFGVSLSLAGVIQYPLTSWLTVKGLVAKGFEGGRVETDLNAKGKEVITDPCKVDASAILSDPNSATHAIGCEIKRTVGGYISWPWTFDLGVKLFDRVNLDVMYLYQGWNTDSDVLAPDHVHTILGAAGVDLY